jgi:hypothetical protein
MPRLKKTVKKRQKSQKIKVRIKSPITNRFSWKTFEVISIDQEGWIKIKGQVKSHFWLHKDIHREYIKKL